jgi:hypothetical protein
VVVGIVLGCMFAAAAGLRYYLHNTKHTYTQADSLIVSNIINDEPQLRFGFAHNDILITQKLLKSKDVPRLRLVKS